ncbi:MAG TPA: DUF4149 domain-containing protein [Ramlibacter sp.]|nr:DUF4149 domain-containing protein [Ramlibacter sp.]
MSFRARLPVLAAALWWGSLSAIGFMAVPLLFQNAATPAIAGGLAAKLFTGQAWLGVACGGLLLMGARTEDGTARMDWAHGAIAYVLLGMLAAILQEFGVAPRIVARQDLRFWHSAGTVLYAAQWLCALVVLWKVTGNDRLSREGGYPGRPS